MIKIEDFDFDKFSFEEKLSKNILIYDVLYKALLDAKPSCIMFDN